MGKFIHVADIHLDSPLKGLSRYEGAPVDVRSVTRQAFDNLIQLAIDEAVDFILMAGDLYDGNWRDYSTGLFFASRMNRLREADIAVYSVRGNHDADSNITRALTLPDNVHELSCQAPETRIDQRLGIAIHGQGYPVADVRDNLAARYPDPVPGLLNIGLLHTALDGREGHEPYAPCARRDLAGKGYDYWALGHVHRREVVHQDAPWIVYSGNLQGRHANETGAKGCTLVEVDDGKVSRLRQCDLDVLRWCRGELDCSNAQSPGEIVDLVRSWVQKQMGQADGRIMVFRPELRGASAAHQDLHRQWERWLTEMRIAIQEVTGDQGWLEKVKLGTYHPTPIRALSQEHLPIRFLLQQLDQLDQDKPLMEEIEALFNELKGRLPHELFAEESGLNLKDSQAMGQFLADVKDLVELSLRDQEGIADEN